MKNILLILIFFSWTTLNAQDSAKVATVITTGQGETNDIAKHNALRSAIEQSYGTFISSKTEVLNDELKKDEIVSVANGNIQKYDILNETQLPNNLFSVTVRSTVSINKLVQFCASKGISAEFQGGLFAVNIKQKLLNQESELIAIQNILKTSNEILKNSFDFSNLNITDPVLVNEQNQQYSIDISFNIKDNSNYQLYLKYLKDNLISLSIAQTELESYLNAKIPIYKIILPEVKEIYLRNKYSAQAIKLFSFNANKNLIDFRLISNVDSLVVSRFTARMRGESYVYDEKFSAKLNSGIEPDIFYFTCNNKNETVSKIEHSKPYYESSGSLEMYFGLILENSNKQDYTKLDILNKGLYDFHHSRGYPMRWLCLNCQRFDFCDILLQPGTNLDFNVKISHILDFAALEKLNGYKIEKHINNNF